MFVPRELRVTHVTQVSNRNIDSHIRETASKIKMIILSALVKRYGESFNASIFYAYEYAYVFVSTFVSISTLDDRAKLHYGAPECSETGHSTMRKGLTK